MPQKEKEVIIKEGTETTEMEGSHGGKEETLPPGFRFHPTDEELITCYLINKISDSSFTGKAITDVDLNKCEPWELPGTYIFMKVVIQDLILCFLRFIFMHAYFNLLL